MNRKGQGTIEYLIIIAIIIVIALVVIGIVLSFTDQTQTTSEKESRAAWQSAYPWAIIDWDSNTSKLTLVVQNNTAGTLYLNSITVDSTASSGISKTTVAPGSKTVVYVTKTCTASDIFSYSTITIDYNSEYIVNQEQAGSKGVVGTCHS